MPTVSIKNAQIAIGQKKLPLISGEVHYWRLNPACWRDCLRAVKAMGISIVATYVPWGYHEYERGKFDFSGKTEATRDLKRFLALTREEKLQVIVRPGPYIYSEWPNDGVPDYAYRYHRLHPTFLRFADVWLKKICAVISPFLATRRGGNIIMVQADNEIDPWPDVFGAQYGLGDKPGMFQDFMQYKYRGTIQALNAVWETEYASFAEVGPYEVCETKAPPMLKRNADYVEFKHYYSRMVAEWCIRAYRSLGIDVPVYLNVYPFFYAHDWKQFAEVSDLVGIDLYPENEFDTDLQDHRKMMDKVRYLRTFTNTPYIAEFASGMWHNHLTTTGVITPNHYRLLTLSMILAGARGWNWYMLVNRDNWYMSPINEWGRARPELFDVFKALADVFHTMKPYGCVKQLDVGATFSVPHYATKAVRDEENVLQQLYDADIDYDFFASGTDGIAPKVLFYAGCQWLSAEETDSLCAYVRRGGTLVLFKVYPRKDADFRRSNPLGLRDPDKTLFKFKRKVTVSLDARTTFSCVSTVGAFNTVPGAAITGTIDGCGDMTVGYVKRMGKGRIVHIALDPNREMLMAILAWCRVSVPAQSESAGVHTGFFVRGRAAYVVVVNNTNEQKTAVVRIDHAMFRRRKFSVKNMISGSVQTYAAQSTPRITVDVPRKDGFVLALTV